MSEDPELCRARPSPRSTARCELLDGHTDGDPEADLQGAADFLASFHAGRTERGHWKFWEVEKP